MVKIIITGYPSLENAVKSLNKGADGYLLKPLKMEDILKVVKEHLKKQQDAKKYSKKKSESSLK